MGAILATRMSVRGVAGLVTDGCYRDTPEIVGLGVPSHAQAHTHTWKEACCAPPRPLLATRGPVPLTPSPPLPRSLPSRSSTPQGSRATQVSPTPPQFAPAALLTLQLRARGCIGYELHPISRFCPEWTSAMPLETGTPPGTTRLGSHKMMTAAARYQAQ